MNYRLAAMLTLEDIKDELPPAKRDHTGTSDAHIHWMLLEIQNNDGFSSGKANRWLGWAQGIIAVRPYFTATLEGFKRVNSHCTCEDEGCPAYGEPHTHKETNR